MLDSLLVGSWLAAVFVCDNCKRSLFRLGLGFPGVQFDAERTGEPDILARILGQVAQLVEQRTENPCVGGSSPPLPSIVNRCKSWTCGGFSMGRDPSENRISCLSFPSNNRSPASRVVKTGWHCYGTWPVLKTCGCYLRAKRSEVRA